jgi:hypothetical protein
MTTRFAEALSEQVSSVLAMDTVRERLLSEDRPEHLDFGHAAALA